MDEDEYIRELSRKIAAVTLIPIEEAEMRVREAITAHTNANLKPFMETKGLKRLHLPAGIKRGIKDKKKQNEKSCENCGHHRSGDVGCEAGGCSLIRENWIP